MRLIASVRKKILSLILFFLVRLMRFFVAMDDKTVLFLAFDGRGYLDNPKAIFEAMLADSKFSDYHFIWAMTQPEKIAGASVLKKGSIAYFYYLSKAKYWVFNAKMPDYLIKKPSQIYLQTWHGTPLKRLAHDMPDTGLSYYRSRLSYQEMLNSYDKDSQLWDYLISPNPFSTEVFASAFRYPKTKIIETGYPRNDVLIKAKPDEIKALRVKYKLPQDKKVILYAPTWRDNAYSLTGYKFDCKLDFAKWREVLGTDYLIIYKPHYLISNHLKVPKNLSDFVITLQATADISDIYLMSDLLVTDYSSVFFDYANLNRPIYFYMPDLATYESKLRGFYLAVPEELPNAICQSEDALLTAIKNKVFDFQRLSEFNKRFNPMQKGQASQNVIEAVFG